MTKTSDNLTFGYTYTHKGGECAFHIEATSIEEAEAKRSLMAQAVCVGQLRPQVEEYTKSP